MVTVDQDLVPTNPNLLRALGEGREWRKMKEKGECHFSRLVRN